MIVRAGTTFKRLAVVLVALSFLAACGGSDRESPGRPYVVATTSIMGDVVRNVAGDAVDLEVLVPRGADPHDFSPSARQVAAINSADLVVANGLLLEEGLDDVIAAARADGGNVLEVASQLDPQPLPGASGDDARLDPHVWLDPQRMADAATLIGAELAKVAPDGDWAAGAAGYAAELEAVDREIESILAAVPPERRLLVTNHDTMGYFAARYGFEVVGVVIGGGSSLASPSAAELAELVDVIEALAVPAVFAETTEPATLAEALAAEAGGVAVVELYTGSLGEPGSDAADLVAMLLTNARRIAAALN